MTVFPYIVQKLKVISIWIWFLKLIIPICFATNSKCEYYQNMELEKTYYIYSPGYPTKYYGGISCRYFAQSPENTQIVLNCEVIDIPSSPNCQQGCLSISLTGKSNFQDAHNYCGKINLTIVSEANSLAIGLFAPWFSYGGRFLCAITAIQLQKPTTTTVTSTICDCGWRKETKLYKSQNLNSQLYKPRIVGGVETGVNEFPPMACLINLERREFFCGATIIALRYALTAGHCLLKETSNKLSLLVGEHNLMEDNDTRSTVEYILDHFEIHPHFDEKSRENDIAVVRTQKSMKFGVDVGPVCLPFRYLNYDFTGITVLALGWGTTEFSGPKSDYLQKVNLKVVTNYYCQQELSDNRIFKNQLCTFALEKDACQYDSGGPILWFDPNKRRLQIIGIISYGISCGIDYPAVNTRVTSFLTWIVSATNDAVYCIN